MIFSMTTKIWLGVTEYLLSATEISRKLHTADDGVLYILMEETKWLGVYCEKNKVVHFLKEGCLGILHQCTG